MFIIPRTPPRNHADRSHVEKRQRVDSIDNYDKFTEKYLAANTVNRSILIEVITDYIGHPVYTYLFSTMTTENVHHIMGYLRTQQSIKMNFILNHLCGISK